jgi:hypothetical protein
MIKGARSRKVRIGALVVINLFAVAFFYLYRSNIVDNPLKTGDWFVQEKIGESLFLDDLGVAAINDDLRLDIFTVNHSARQSILLNDGQGQFTDQLLELGLNQNAAYPGIGPSTNMPKVEEPGLYLYWHLSEFVLQAHRIGELHPFKGELTLPVSANVKSYDDLLIDIYETEAGQTVVFNIEGDGRLVVESENYFFNPRVKLAEDMVLDQIFVGQLTLNPTSPSFSLTPGRDRHAMAWADYNGDGAVDVFIIRGGACLSSGVGVVDG